MTFPRHLLRLVNRRILDLLSGVGYPENPESPFAGNGARPLFTESSALAFSPWPGVANAYDENGRLADPQRFLAGQNAPLGIVLGFAELRALLLGFAQPRDVSKPLAAQYYRFGQGVSQVLLEQLAMHEGEGLKQGEYTAAIRRLFSLGADLSQLDAELARLELLIITTAGTIPVINANLLALAALTGTGLAARTGMDTWALRTLQPPAAGITITNPAGIAGDPTFVLANDLAAIEALSTFGLAARTALDTWATRTLQQPAAGLTITNPAGIAGDPTFVLANDLAAIEALTSIGLATRTATDTWETRTLQQPAAGLTITNPAGIAGDPTFVLANDLAAIEALSTFGLAARTALDTWATRTLQQPAAGLTITSPAGIAGDPTFVLANDLAAIEALTSIGLATRTATDTWETRTLQQPAAGLTITNPAGIAGDPTFVLANDLAAIEALAGTGLATRTATDTWTTRTLTAPAAGLTITNPAGIAGNPTFVLANDLAALEALATTGFGVRTATDTWLTRSLTAGPGVSITNGDAVAGNPTISTTVAPLIVTGNTTLTAANSLVINNYSGAVSISLTLPSAPTDGTPIFIFNAQAVQKTFDINRGGSDTIHDGTTTSISGGLSGENILLVYDAANTRWRIANLKHERIYVRWTAAAANDYLQAGGTGGAVGTAFPIRYRGGTMVTQLLTATARSAPAANQTVKLQTVNSSFGGAADLTNNLAATFTSAGASTPGLAVNVLSSPATGTQGWLVLQATTTIVTAMDIVIDLFVL